MFAIPGILALVAFVYIRPQEFVEPLKSVPILYIACAAALVGALVDLRLGKSRLEAAPQLVWILGLFFWIMLTVLIRQTRTLPDVALELGIVLVLYLVIAHAVQSFWGLRAVASVIAISALFVALVGIDQGLSDRGCVLIDETTPGDQTFGKFDGRPCEATAECYLGDAEPGRQYMCEKIGLFGTTSVQDRVRYRGVLQDPNELALAAAVAVPLVFAGGRKRWAISRWTLGTLSVALVLICTVMTGSRGGMLVFLAVIGAYFIKRLGWRGVAIGALLGGPVLLLGGRAGEKAATSTLERIDCWYEALMMWRQNPLFGVGFQQFGEHHYLTAHNSYLLALAELGLPGMFLFSVIVYLSAKVPYSVLRHYRHAGTFSSPAAGSVQLDPGVAEARAWAMSLFAAYCGLAVGIFFLSFSYHLVLWIYFGLSGALYAAVRRHDARFVVNFGWREVVLVAFADLTIIGIAQLAVRAVPG
jgi:hypothetical protein